MSTPGRADELRTIRPLPSRDQQRHRAPSLLTRQMNLRGQTAAGTAQPGIGWFVPRRLDLLIRTSTTGIGSVLMSAVDRRG